MQPPVQAVQSGGYGLRGCAAFDCLFQQVTGLRCQALTSEYLSVAAIAPRHARSRTWRPDALRESDRSGYGVVNNEGGWTRERL